MKFIKRFFNHLKDSFVACAVLLDESKRINEYGDWNEYHRKRNEKLMRKEARKKS